MTRHSRKLLAVASALAAVLLAGCEQEGVSGQPETDQPPPPPTTTERTTTTTPRPTTTTTKPKPTPATPGLCTSGDLKLSLGRGDAAAGTMWRPLRFTNKSSSSCVIQGFPGVSYVAGDDGHQVGAAAYRDGTKGAPVTLRPGSTAYAAVGFTNVGNYDPADCKPTKVRGLRVYPPQETHSMYLANPGKGCANSDVASHHLKVQTIRPGSG